MDYENLHKETLAALQQMVSEGKITEEIARRICADFVKESEDERIVKAIIKLVKDTSKSYTINALGVDQKDMIDYLEKQGEQKFPSLSEKEIVCLKRILDFLREEHNSYTGKDFTNEIAVLEWLITHPVLINSSELQQNQGEQKPSWSEEDERIRYAICDTLDRIDERIMEYNHQLTHQQVKSWLKSLKERHTWKPSNEQMDALWDSIPENVKEISEREMLLDSLYQDLKKLRKE